jgi:hypothetical protein
VEYSYDGYRVVVWNTGWLIGYFGSRIFFLDVGKEDGQDVSLQQSRMFRWCREMLLIQVCDKRKALRQYGGLF